MELTKKYKINRYFSGEIKEDEDLIIVEYPLTIYINKQEFITLICTPDKIKPLVIGFLHSEGIINSYNDIEELSFNSEIGRAEVLLVTNDTFGFTGEKITGKRVVTTGCGKGRTIAFDLINEERKLDNDLKISFSNVENQINEFNKKSDLFLETGGVHSCALSDGEKFIYFEEDIGRHNALDKIIGNSLIDGISIQDKILFCSGRISSEMIMKALRIGIPAIVSRSAATSIAIDIARKNNITLVGFARGKKMNIYNNIKLFY